MAMPAQKPATSEQTVSTPRPFLNAIENRFGPIGLDLAANAKNHVCDLWLGPGSPLVGGTDSLDPRVSWSGRPLRFLNPPFGDIKPWAAKCAEQRAGAFITMLAPAFIGSDWFFEHVHGKALVLALAPRLKFVGHKNQFPGSLILCVYGPWVAPGFDCWRWK